MKLSEKMLQAGWNIIHEKNGSFTVYGSNNRKYTFNQTTGQWSCSEQIIINTLEEDLDLIKSGKLFPMTTASRLTALSHTKNSSQPIQMICKNRWAANKTVLHLGTGKDIKAKAELLESGCLEITDYDPNFYPDRKVLLKQYDVIIANYVLNILPPDERHLVYLQIKDSLADDGTAYLTAQGDWPVENKYKITGRIHDGYLIQTGFNKTFRKGYTSDSFINEIKNEIGGRPELIKIFYSNSFVKWTKAHT